MRCRRCGDFASEYCWYCSGRLCYSCWEHIGHCGHPEADAQNERAREVVQPRKRPQQMKYGDTGEHVRQLQRRLMDAGIALPEYGADGQLGDETWSALRSYAEREGLPWRPEVPGEVLERLRGRETSAGGSRAPSGGGAFDDDSALATRVVPSLGYREGAYDERREYGGIVVHSTGSGPLQRYREGWRPEWASIAGDASEHEAALLDIAVAIYRGVMQAGPHYVVLGREIVQVCPEYLAAWHVGRDGVELYGHPDWVDRARRQYGAELAWWPRRWGSLRTPLALAQGRLWGDERSANRGTIGIEVVHPHDEAGSPPSDDTLETLGRLVRDICGRRGIPRRADHVCGHADAHPLDRTSRGEPFDPPEELWSPGHARLVLGSA